MSASPMSDDDLLFFCGALESLDLPKDPIAWLLARVRDKAANYRESGDERSAREMDNRAGSINVRLRRARTASIGDERSNPEFFSPRELDRLAAVQPRQSKAQARAEVRQILARRKADGHPNAKTIPTRTHVQKWIEDNADRADDMVTFGDHKELLGCLALDDYPSTETEYLLSTNRAMTLNEFKRLIGSVANP